MDLKRVAMLLVLPLALAACDNGQPTYSASNANSTPPPPPPPQAEQQAPPPVVQAQAEPPKPAPAAPAPQDLSNRAKALQDNSTTRFAQVMPGKMGVMPKLGVGSCDDYVERYRTCFNNTQITPEDKHPLRRALAKQMRKWKTAAADGKLSEVAVECTDAAREARVEFSKVGCKTF
jgi:hypothetical protein